MRNGIDERDEREGCDDVGRSWSGAAVTVGTATEGKMRAGRGRGRRAKRSRLASRGGGWREDSARARDEEREQYRGIATRWIYEGYDESGTVGARGKRG